MRGFLLLAVVCVLATAALFRYSRAAPVRLTSAADLEPNVGKRVVFDGPVFHHPKAGWYVLIGDVTVRVVKGERIPEEMEGQAVTLRGQLEKAPPLPKIPEGDITPDLRAELEQPRYFLIRTSWDQRPV